MNFVYSVYIIILLVLVLSIIESAIATMTSSNVAVNLTNWREHRRKKRFIIFENGGICKFVCGITFPVNLADKRPWRQLVMTMNLHYQFPVPPKPIYWWDKWDRRNLANAGTSINTPDIVQEYKDEAQEFLYEFVENLMDRKGINGRACLQKAICENAQVHINQGVYAEILHRVLQPHRNLLPDYTEAWHLGKKGFDCHHAYPKAKNCLIDNYLHVREDYRGQHFVK